MSTHNGRQAEEKAAEYLVKHGYQIVSKNWRAPSCEIDIIARKRDRRFFGAWEYYFVEVKYRSAPAQQGSGLAYITTRKSAQMRHAAQAWVAHKQLQAQYHIAACEVAGSGFEVSNFIKSISYD